jgi:hypothetical protein
MPSPVRPHPTHCQSVGTLARLASLGLVLLLATTAGCGESGGPTGSNLDAVLPDGLSDVQLDALPDGVSLDQLQQEIVATDVAQPEVADDAGTDVQEPGTDTVTPGTDAAEVGSDAAESGSDTGITGSDTAEAGSDTVAPGSDAAETGSDTVAPGSDVAETGSDAAETGSDTAETGSDTATTGSDTAETGSDIAETGSDTTTTGSDTAETGSDIAETGSDTTTTGSDTAETGSDTAETGSDTTTTGSDTDSTIWSCVVVYLVDGQGQPIADGNVQWTELGVDPTTSVVDQGEACRAFVAGTSVTVQASALGLWADPAEAVVTAPATAASCGTPAGCSSVTVILLAPDCTQTSACDDGNVCTSNLCDQGVCQFAALEGATCEDGDSCTLSDTCALGLCKAGTATTCDDGNVCTTDSCDPLTGTCSAQAGPDALPCDDGDACTLQDTCLTGSCVGSDPVVCGAKDGCHLAGVCDTATGLCSDPAKDDGTPCTDLSACTKVDTCVAGQCVGGSPVVCADPAICKLPGVCQANTGMCTYQDAGDTTFCSDNNACTAGDKCNEGECKPGTAVDCNDNNPCTSEFCSTAVGCVIPYNTDTCQDGNACTENDICSGGQCKPGPVVVCDDGNPCTTDSCDTDKGCVFQPLAGPCSDGDACTQSDTCVDGSCKGSNPVQCSAKDQCHVAGVCDPQTGVCSDPDKPDGVRCEDGNSCSQTDTCQGGTCTGSNPVVCTALDQCHEAGVCNSQTGICTNPAKIDGADCSDDNPCTTTDTCQDGTCEGGAAKVCVALDQCHVAGSCDVQTGACSNPNKEDGSACTDGDLCSQTDTCQSGSCTGGNPVVCMASSQCHDAGTCNPQDGICSNPVKAALAPCNDGNPCTTTDACDSGDCVGQAVVCSPLDACHVAGSCDPSNGNCSNPDQDPSAYDDQVACTIDACSNGTISHTPDDSQCGELEQCTTSGCAPMTEAGGVIVSEFQALGAEFIELRNTTAQPIDVRGWTLRNSQGETAVLRAATDPTGLAETPVVIAAGASLYGVANPGSPPGSAVAFLWGPPASGFDLADSGDYLVLSAADATVQDFVDFRTLVSDPNTPLTADSFVAHSAASAQLEPTKLTATANNTPTHWCTTFFAAGGSSRVGNTAGADNGSCSRVVINEVAYDPSGADDQKAFVELAGPGGALVAGYQLHDVEGKGTSAGKLNTEGDLAPGETDGVVAIPAGVRLPADGVLLIADADNDVTTTQVAGFVAGVDVLVRDIDLENGGEDAVQLVDAQDALADVLGHESSGANLAVTAASNGLAMWETSTALTVPAGNGGVTVSFARNAASADTDNNRADFRGDPSPTPGAINDGVNFAVTNFTPDDGPVGFGTTGMTVTGTDFSPLMRFQIGNLASSVCTLVSATQATCNTGTPTGLAAGKVELRFTLPDSIGAPAAVFAEGYTLTASHNNTGEPEEADFTQLDTPTTFSTTPATTSPFIYCRLNEAGATEAAGAPSQWIAEVGYGSASSGPTGSASWRFFSMTYEGQTGSTDSFVGSFPTPTVTVSTNFRYTCRFSSDGGVHWTYADINGAGSGSGLYWSSADLGLMTVAP